MRPTLSRPVLAGGALIVLAVALAYAPAVSGGFILDDDALLTANGLIRSADGLYRIWFTREPYDYWPVTNTTLWLEWRLWGMQSTGYHVTNLLLHIGTVLLMWRILWRLAFPGAFLAALLFAVHPVTVETVAWITQRKTLLATFFCLLSILWYLNAEAATPPAGRSAPLPNRWYWLSLLACALAMLSKVSAAPLPAILLAILWFRRSPPFGSLRATQSDRLLEYTAPFFLVVAVLLCVNLAFRSYGGETPIGTVGVTGRLLGAGAALWFYLSKALLPINLAFHYPEWNIRSDQWRWWVPLLAALGVTATLWRYRLGCGRPFLLAWVYFCVALVPVLGFVNVGFRQPLLVADHYQHLALVGIMALVAAGWAAWQRRMRAPHRWVPPAAAAAIVSLLTFLTSAQSRLYTDALTLYQDALQKNPDSWMAHNNVGALLFEAGRSQEAIQHYQQALQIKPDYPDAHSNLGVALAASGQVQEAIVRYQEALQLRPNYPEAHYNLGNALVQLGQLDAAILQYEQALRFRLYYPDADHNLVTALRLRGRLPEVIEHYEQTLRRNPDSLETHMNLGNALAEANRWSEAAAHYEQSVRLKPDLPTAYVNLGTALRATSRPVEAVTRYEQALHLNPDLAEAHHGLGVALADLNRPEEAVAHYREAIRLKPDYSRAHSHLAEALTQMGLLSQAIAEFEEVLRLDPNDRDARSALEQLRTRQQQATEARE